MGRIMSEKQVGHITIYHGVMTRLETRCTCEACYQWSMPTRNVQSFEMQPEGAGRLSAEPCQRSGLSVRVCQLAHSLAFSLGLHKL